MERLTRIREHTFMTSLEMVKNLTPLPPQLTSIQNWPIFFRKPPSPKKGTWKSLFFQVLPPPPPGKLKIIKLFFISQSPNRKDVVMCLA